MHHHRPLKLRPAFACPAAPRDDGPRLQMEIRQEVSGAWSWRVGDESGDLNTGAGFPDAFAAADAAHIEFLAQLEVVA